MKNLFLAILLLLPVCSFSQKSEDDPDKKEKTDSRTAENIAVLTADILRKSHERQFANRPQIMDYQFDADAPKLKRYLSSIKEKKPLARERKRIKMIASIKQNLIRTLERNPYKGPIRMRNGVSRKGVIALANENRFMLKTGGKSREYQWSFVAPLQLAKMCEYFANQKLKLKGGTGKSSSVYLKIDASEQLLAAAVLCDWYNDYENAVLLVKKAAELSKDTELLAEKLFLD